jgi:hypothetical protein
MYTFNIQIENADKKLSNGRIVHIMAAMCILVYGIRGFSDLPKTSLLIYTGIPAGLIILYITICKKKVLQNIQSNKLLRIMEAAFLIMAAIHFWQYNFHLIAFSFLISVIGILISMLIENQVLGSYIISINDDGVRKPGKAEIISWVKITNVMVKHQILTVDLATNYIMQSKFTNELNVEEENTFNTYCKNQITKSQNSIH